MPPIVYAEAIGGQNISVNITALGSGGFSAVLETGAPDHTVLKYVESKHEAIFSYDELDVVNGISWLSLDIETGLLSGVPDDEDVGLYEIVFSVEDAAGAVSTSDPVTLTVNNINDPVYIDDGQTSLFRSEVLNSYQILISDEDLLIAIHLQQLVFHPGCH